MVAEGADLTYVTRKAVALQLDTGRVPGFPAFTSQLRTTLRNNWKRDTFDYLVNNAGHGTYAMLDQTTEAKFDELCNVHFKGVYVLTQTLLPLIADGGRIVNLSSGLTRVRFPGYAASAAVKGAVEVLNPLHGQGAGRTRHQGEHGSAGRDRNRFRRRRGARQSGDQQAVC